MIFLLHFTKWNFRMNGAGATPLQLALIFTIFPYHVLIEDRDERSLPSIIKAIKLDPRNMFALREGKDIFLSHVLSQA